MSGIEDILMSNARSGILTPATQCGHVAPIDAATRFQKQDLCVPVGAKGGN